MKTQLFGLLSVLLMSASAQASDKTLCGTFRYEQKANGNWAPSLNVPAGPLLPAFSTYELKSTNPRVREGNKVVIGLRKSVINLLQEGEEYCVSGATGQNPDFTDYVVVNSAGRALTIQPHGN